MDTLLLEDLQNQITVLENAVKAGGKPREFMLEISQLRKLTISKHYKNWTAVCNAGCSVLSTLQGIYYVASILISVSPAVLQIAPFIIPLQWVNLLRMLVNVIKS